MAGMPPYLRFWLGLWVGGDAVRHGFLKNRRAGVTGSGEDFECWMLDVGWKREGEGLAPIAVHFVSPARQAQAARFDRLVSGGGIHGLSFLPGQWGQVPGSG